MSLKVDDSGTNNGQGKRSKENVTVPADFFQINCLPSFFTSVDISVRFSAKGNVPRYHKKIDI